MHRRAVDRHDDAAEVVVVGDYLDDFDVAEAVVDVGEVVAQVSSEVWGCPYVLLRAVAWMCRR